MLFNKTEYVSTLRRRTKRGLVLPFKHCASVVFVLSQISPYIITSRIGLALYKLEDQSLDCLAKFSTVINSQISQL